MSRYQRVKTEVVVAGIESADKVSWFVNRGILTETKDRERVA